MHKNVDMCNLLAHKSSKYGAKFAKTPYFDVNTPEIAMMGYTHRKFCAGDDAGITHIANLAQVAYAAVIMSAPPTKTHTKTHAKTHKKTHEKSKPL